MKDAGLGSAAAEYHSGRLNEAQASECMMHLLNV